SPSITLSESGTYTIIVSDDNFLEVGDYVVNLQFTSGKCASSVACGDSTTSSIANKGEVDAYAFDARAGDGVIFNAVATSGILCARADLYGPTGAVIVDHIPCDGASPAIRLSDDGTYTVIVYAQGLKDVGDYNFNLQSTTGNCASPIGCGQPV